MRFTPRLTAPNKTDRHFINYSKGGYNTCIVINQSTGYVMPNCVGYAQGRLLEIRSESKVNWKLPACNAEDWYEMAQRNGMSVGQTPKLGAVVCWRAGQTHNSADGAGHVAIIEEIKPNGDIVISQSAYGGQEFYLSALTKASGYMYAASRPLVGFIYCGIEFDEDKQQDSTITSIRAGLKVELRNVQAYASESSLSSYGLRGGTYYTWDGNPKNGRIRLTNAVSKVGVPGQVSFWASLADIGLADTGVKTPTAGAKYTLSNTSVYGTEKGPSIGKRSGVYYVWDPTVRNGRIRMTNNPARVGVPGQVSFWVEENRLI
nr:MAG TPA: CHAP domain protein [Caudoviricetes sp.]